MSQPILKTKRKAIGPGSKILPDEILGLVRIPRSPGLQACLLPLCRLSGNSIENVAAEALGSIKLVGLRDARFGVAAQQANSTESCVDGSESGATISPQAWPESINVFIPLETSHMLQSMAQRSGLSDGEVAAFIVETASQGLVVLSAQAAEKLHQQSVKDLEDLLKVLPKPKLKLIATAAANEAAS